MIQSQHTKASLAIIFNNVCPDQIWMLDYYAAKQTLKEKYSCFTQTGLRLNIYARKQRRVTAGIRLSCA